MKRPVKIFGRWGLGGNARKYAITFVVSSDLNLVNNLSYNVPASVDTAWGVVARILAKEKISDNDIYRICIPYGTRIAEVMCIGLDSVDNELEGVYDDVDELPKWMQESVAVLSMLPIDKPNQQVAGVGRRIAENIYWAYKPTM
jgi:hypothetical protein